ncbi:DNA polymerase epsilon catalytic subunit A [Trichinella spiralis]|uniref:DNA polymerase epsilon catalytic subunit A n=1 Tax=Trichinella spiralis TaxID=6334 RepID=UPI0001EFC341|nr:DNA polymerase epsilon catalytic subunit A [Trichinella spiralis]
MTSQATGPTHRIFKNKELGLFAYWVSIGSELHNVRLRAPRIFYVYQQIPKQIDSTDDELFSDTKVYPENPLIATSFLHVILTKERIFMEPVAAASHNHCILLYVIEI